MADNTRSDSDSTRGNDTYEAGTGKLKKLGPDKEKVSDLEKAASAARLQSTAGKNLGGLEKGGAGAPKQMPGESIQDFAARRRKYQEEQAAGQKKAFEPASK